MFITFCVIILAFPHTLDAKEDALAHMLYVYYMHFIAANIKLSSFSVKIGLINSINLFI